MRTIIVPNQAIATFVTQWTYDSHNRLLEMIYPDEEKVTYDYNLGGQLTHVRGYKSYGYDYVNKIGYDKFEQRTYLKYCNGAETFYSYDPQRRRLQNLVVNAKAGTIMDNAYTYDAVSNVLSVKNDAPLPQSGKAGGQMSHSYTYDALYRLVSATGTYTGADSKTASYTLAMGYDNMHRITSKSQHLTQQNVQFNGTLNAGYDLTYTYQDSTGHKFQLANVRDVNYRMEGTAGENDKVNNGHRYLYDANGNLVYINTSRVKRDGKEDAKASEQKFKWDEENRLLAADENGFVSKYWYDADGERTVKTSGEGEQIYVNSEFAGGRTNTAKFSLYVSPYLVANQGGRYTKHIYIGSQRIVSKLGDFASYGSDPRRIPYAGSEADAVTVDYKGKYSAQQQVIKDNYATFNVPYNGEDNNDYVDGEGFCCNDGTLETAQARAMAANTAKAKANNFHDADTYEKMQFYYHPDHLGSSSYITNLDGEVAQHIEYVPFGEVFIEERNNTWNTPYLFNAKEFDENTGMYYFGARYYEPRLSVWMSVDPLAGRKPMNSGYTYGLNNPLKYIDPTGLDDIFDEKGNFIRDTGKGSAILIQNSNQELNKLSSSDYTENNKGNREMLTNVAAHYLRMSDKQSFEINIDEREASFPSGAAFYNLTGTEKYGVVLQNGKINEVLDDKYIFESITFHESLHRYDSKTHGGTIGEVEAIISQTNHKSWNNVPESYRQSQASYASSSLTRAIPKLSKSQIDNYINRLNDAFIGTATYSFENNTVNFTFNLPEVIVPRSE